jgi:hypothetical protein
MMGAVEFFLRNAERFSEISSFYSSLFYLSYTLAGVGETRAIVNYFRSHFDGMVFFNEARAISSRMDN